MILIATLSDCQRECERRFKGKKIRSRIYLAADKFNLCIASQTDESQIIGHKYCHRLEMLSKYFDEFSLSQEALYAINKSFKLIFGVQDTKIWSYKQIDKEFKLFKRADNGEDLLIYRKLKEFIASHGQMYDDDNTNMHIMELHESKSAVSV